MYLWLWCVGLKWRTMYIRGKQVRHSMQHYCPKTNQIPVQIIYLGLCYFSGLCNIIACRSQPTCYIYTYFLIYRRLDVITVWTSCIFFILLLALLFIYNSVYTVITSRRPHRRRTVYVYQSHSPNILKTR